MVGEGKNRREAEIAALRTGIDLGMTLIDTAECAGRVGLIDDEMRMLIFCRA